MCQQPPILRRSALVPAMAYNSRSRSDRPDAKFRKPLDRGLKDHLGMALFHRIHQRLTLPDAGRRLARNTNAIPDAMHKATVRTMALVATCLPADAC